MVVPMDMLDLMWALTVEWSCLSSELNSAKKN